MKNILESRFIEYIVIGLTMIISLLCVFPLSEGPLHTLSNYTVHIMIVFLLLGILFLVLGNNKLMYTFFFACMFLNVFLKEASNKNFDFPAQRVQGVFSIVHINLSNIEMNYEEVFSIINERNPDVISFQELTPQWEPIINEYFDQAYSFRDILTRIDPFGMAILSKLPLLKNEPLVYDNAPSLNDILIVDNFYQIRIICTYTYPEKIDTHLSQLANQISKFDTPLINIGDFNCTYWSTEIRNYRAKTKLKNSRRDISMTMWEVPVDHIFYSHDLECSNFIELFDSNQNKIGIEGHYQIITKKINK